MAPTTRSQTREMVQGASQISSHIHNPHPNPNLATAFSMHNPGNDNDNDNDATTSFPQSRLFAKSLSLALGQAIIQALSAFRPTASPDPAKYPKAKEPRLFNGRRRRDLRTWICENEICFRTAPNLYRTDLSKVMFAGSFLEGDAKSWFTNYFSHTTDLPTFMSDWMLFTAELQLNFGLADELGAAEEDMRKLSMSNEDHASHFTARFRAIVTNFHGTWGDRSLRNEYLRKMAPRLRAQFVSAGSLISPSLEPLIAKVDRFDRVYWADQELTRVLGSSSTLTLLEAIPPKSVPNSSTCFPPAAASAELTNRVTTATAPITISKPSLTTHLTKEGKLTLEEKQHRLNIGACFYCGEVGHLTAQCRKKGQPQFSFVRNHSPAPPLSTASTTPLPTASASTTPLPTASASISPLSTASTATPSPRVASDKVEGSGKARAAQFPMGAFCAAMLPPSGLLKLPLSLRSPYLLSLHLSCR